MTGFKIDTVSDLNPIRFLRRGLFSIRRPDNDSRKSIARLRRSDENTPSGIDRYPGVPFGSHSYPNEMN